MTHESGTRMGVMMLLLAALLLSCPLATMAQEVPATGHCPQLPDGAGLSWESSNRDGNDFCRALRADGSEAFGLYISMKPNFKPRSSNREESSFIGDHQVTWYRAELATKPGVQAREALLSLVDGRKAHLWLQAGSADELVAGYRLVGQLQFNGSLQITDD